MKGEKMASKKVFNLALIPGVFCILLAICQILLLIKHGMLVDIFYPDIVTPTEMPFMKYLTTVPYMILNIVTGILCIVHRKRNTYITLFVLGITYFLLHANPCSLFDVLGYDIYYQKELIISMLYVIPSAFCIIAGEQHYRREKAKNIQKQ
jgi:hypothetical protein